MPDANRPLSLLWLDDAPVYLQALEEAGLADRVEAVPLRAAETPPAALLGRVATVLAWDCPPGALAQMPKLGWVQALTAGVEGWIGRPDLAPHVLLTCARGVHRVQMPENILGALFHIAKPFATAGMQQAERRWQRLTSRVLAGTTLGIVGLGTIGQELARKAAALEMRVIGCRRSGAAVPGVERVLPLEGLDELLGASDFVVLLLPVTPETVDMMDARRLSAMRRGAWLLNFARGEHVVDSALIEAVISGHLGGAVLDAFRQEPLPPHHPFWTTPGITVLPHIGGRHAERDRMVAALFVENLRRFLAGAPLTALADRRRGY